MSNPLVNLITQAAQQRGVDPRAALAVASREGLGGGVGDNGTSFGPFQLHQGGAYPSWAPQQQQAAQQWASSPAGVNYALDSIAGVAKGLTGSAAINNIVRRFERPANPDAEVAGAISSYGGGLGSYGGGAGGAGPQPSSGAVSGTRPASNLFMNLVTSLLGHDTGGYVDPGLAFKPFPNAPGGAGIVQVPRTPPDNTVALLRALLSAQGKPVAHTTPPVAPAEPAVGSTPSGPGPSRLAQVPAQISTHPVEVNSQIVPSVMQISRDFGVKVESGYRSPEHNAAVGGAENSDHLKGNAVDFVGPPEAMISLYHWAQGRFPYVEPWSQAHGNHVHISFIR